ncbi:poly-gamma-glutamate hydrolase family protein [Streptomyces yaizuensis]|uniref:Uncharacterized protein n=1 Tax=Streptomyces yaizuensis TaxID=2989713 RepID=A0ABQ5P7P1_9ACTN|nr:poly-gamma-glutamate hydrolase family protein [Streptomyces sp. YSPA8]GLF98604.1 hypothetical protein SYYSPA8_29925 [Streptomyces sp. YSPA8]
MLAPHGGGIEAGTSEIALAVAGYRADSPLEPVAANAPVYDYWMFEGLLTGDNHSTLHVTSSGCDDPIALSIAGGNLNALSIHGCTEKAAGVAETELAVVVGGLNQTFKRYLIEEIEEGCFTRALRPSNPSVNFTPFVTAVRTAITRIEAGQKQL